MRAATEPKHGAAPTRLKANISTGSFRKHRVSSINISHLSSMKISSSLAIPAYRMVIIESETLRAKAFLQTIEYLQAA
jgi:hypothetical protein